MLYQAEKIEDWCLHPVGAGLNWKLVLPPGWCWVTVRVGALSKLVLAFGGCSLVELVLN